MSIIPNIFIISPLRAIMGIVTYPELKTIAFGGVATGSMKAQEAAIAAGAIIIKGFSPIPEATPAKMGNIIAVVAVLLVNSVRNIIRIMVVNIKKK